VERASSEYVNIIPCARSSSLVSVHAIALRVYEKLVGRLLYISSVQHENHVRAELPTCSCCVVVLSLHACNNTQSRLATLAVASDFIRDVMCYCITEHPNGIHRTVVCSPLHVSSAITRRRWCRRGGNISGAPCPPPRAARSS